MTATIIDGPLIASLYISAGFCALAAMSSACLGFLRLRIPGLWWLVSLSSLGCIFQILVAQYHTAASMEQAVFVQKWQNTLTVILLFSFAGYMAEFTGFRHSKPLLWLIGAFSLVFIVLNYQMPYGGRFSTVRASELITFPWGEQLQILRGELSNVSAFVRVVYLCVLLWGFWWSIQQLRQRNWATGILLGTAIAILLASAVVSAQIERGQLNFIYIGGFGITVFAVIAVVLVFQVVQDANDRLQQTNIALHEALESQQKTQQIVEHLAFNDTLTELPNRAALFGHLHSALQIAQREQKEVAVLHIDLDRFDVINDMLGANIGDRILQEVARRLRAENSATDLVARLNGDEFIFVTLDNALHERAAKLAAHIHHQLSVPVHVEEYDLHITASIGIALYPQDGETTQALLTASDLAKREAKRQGCNQSRFFHQKLNVDLHERMHLGNALRGALAQQQFELYFQPQIDARDGRITSIEALLRWHHPQAGMISPDRFIPLAEEMHLMTAIGQWVLDASLRQLAQWRAEGIEEIRMAVNISAQQLLMPELIDCVEDTLNRHGLTGRDLELEITESMLMQDPDFCVTQLQKLSDLGVRIAMDDFGTGYSSLNQLKRLPIDTLKIDRSFVVDLDRNPDDASICRATIHMAKSMGLDTVAEGVENEAQASLLRTLDCERFQGYLYGRPMDARATADFLSAQAPVRAGVR